MDGSCGQFDLCAEAHRTIQPHGLLCAGLSDPESSALCCHGLGFLM